MTAWNLSSTLQAFVLTTRRVILRKAFAGLRATSPLTICRGKAVLDHKNIKKKESKHEEHDIPGCVTDMLSSIYYVASLPLLPNKTYSFPINDGGATVNVMVHVEAQGADQNAGGDLQCDSRAAGNFLASSPGQRQDLGLVL